MAFGSVNTNPAAFIALQNLSQTSRQLAEVQNRVSTGLEVSGVVDNSSTFIIAQNQRADLGGINAIRESLDRASSTLDVAINAAETVSDLLIEAREVAVKASDVGLDSDSRTALNNDFNAIISQIDSVVGQADFNGNNIIKDSPNNISAVIGVNSDGTTSNIDVAGVDLTTDSVSATSSGTVSIDVTSADTLNAVFTTGENDLLKALFDEGNFTAGLIIDNGDGTFSTDLSVGTFTDPNTTPSDGDETFVFDLGGETLTFTGTFADTAEAQADFIADLEAGTATVAASGDGNADLTVGALNAIDLTTEFGRTAAVKAVDDFSKVVNNTLADFGAKARQFELQNEFSSNLADAIEEGIGNLVDADLSRESARLQSLQVKQQLGLQALSIANQGPGTVLSLFR